MDYANVGTAFAIHMRQTWDTKLWFLSLVEDTKRFQPRILSRFSSVGWESSSDSKPEEIRDKSHRRTGII